MWVIRFIIIKNQLNHFLDLNRQSQWYLQGIYPVDSEDFEQFQEAIEKLTLNDASVTFEKKTSAALGLGFRCGFLRTSSYGCIQATT